MEKKKFKKNTTRKKIQFLYLVYSCMVVKPARSIHQFCYAFPLFPLIFLLYRFFYIANKSICSAHINTYILYKFHAKWYIIEITVCAPMYSPLTTNTKKKVGRAKKQLSGTDIFKTVITNVFNSFHTILWLEK